MMNNHPWLVSILATPTSMHQVDDTKKIDESVVVVALMKDGH